MAYVVSSVLEMKGEGQVTCLTATEARKRLYALLDTVADLASIPGMRASIRRGLKTPVEKCHKEFGW